MTIASRLQPSCRQRRCPGPRVLARSSGQVPAPRRRVGKVPSCRLWRLTPRERPASPLELRTDDRWDPGPPDSRPDRTRPRLGTRAEGWATNRRVRPPSLCTSVVENGHGSCSRQSATMMDARPTTAALTSSAPRRC